MNMPTMPNRTLGSSQILTQSAGRDALRIPKPINVVRCQAAATTIYTARTDADFQIQLLVAANVSASDSDYTLHLVPSGGSASISNMIAFEVKIPVGGSAWIFTPERPALLQPGASLQALCDVDNDVNFYGWGYDYQGSYQG
jgi:hypothetical protein